MLKVEEASVVAGGRHLVADVSLALRPGTLVALLGPNGAGKSTLLRLISGELRPQKGAVLLDGIDISTMRPAALSARRAVVSQSSPLAFPFTVREVVALGITVPGLQVTPGWLSEAVETALERVDLAHLADRDYTTLSGGERQRTHLARAFCQMSHSDERSGAKLLLLDEPTASLDLAHQLLVLGEALRTAEDGAAVLVVLHDVNLAARFAHEAILIADGRLQVAGRPSEILRDDALSEIYRCRVRTNRIPADSTPFVLPQVCEEFPR